MPNRSNNPTDIFANQHLSGLLREWMEAISLLQQGNTRLQLAIDENTNKPYRSDSSQTQLTELMQLKQEICYGLVQLENEMTTTKEVDLAPDAVKLIEHIQFILLWFLEINRKLGSTIY